MIEASPETGFKGLEKRTLETETLERRKTLRQLLRYAISCGFVLVSKLAMTWVLIPWLPPPLAYLLVHGATFFISYSVHTRFSFISAYSWRRLKTYFAAVILFKVADFMLFTVLFATFNVNAMPAVLLASVAIMLFRFLVVRRVLNHADTLEDSPNLDCRRPTRA